MSDEELELLIEGLDAHKYWELADDELKNDGYVISPGSNTPELAATIAALDLLTKYLETRLGEDTPARALELEINQVEEEDLYESIDR